MRHRVSWVNCTQCIGSTHNSTRHTLARRGALLWYPIITIVTTHASTWRTLSRRGVPWGHPIIHIVIVRGRIMFAPDVTVAIHADLTCDFIDNITIKNLTVAHTTKNQYTFD